MRWGSLHPMNLSGEDYPNDAELLRSALENSHTKWVIEVLNWTLLSALIIPILFVGINYSKKGRFVSAIFCFWFILAAWQACVSLLAPVVAEKWTGDKRFCTPFLKARPWRHFCSLVGFPPQFSPS